MKHRNVSVINHEMLYRISYSSLLNQVFKFNNDMSFVQFIKDISFNKSQYITIQSLSKFLHEIEMYEKKLPLQALKGSKLMLTLLPKTLVGNSSKKQNNLFLGFNVASYKAGLDSFFLQLSDLYSSNDTTLLNLINSFSLRNINTFVFSIKDIFNFINKFKIFDDTLIFFKVKFVITNLIVGLGKPLQLLFKNASPKDNTVYIFNNLNFFKHLYRINYNVCLYVIHFLFIFILIHII